ncbi:MAG: bifunctional metallophosphatase/5'-nucleotidase [Anaerolineae bacterium]|nr:bifunctional metallophosphatase/5'-nucleotidase [Anaerolineae bacterium]
MARRATVIREARDEYEHVLVLDAGEALLNDQEPAKGSRGQTSVRALNQMRYDAVALGMRDLSLLTLPELRARIGEAEFAFLSANTFVRASNELLVAPYLLVGVADHRVAILGLTEAGSTAELLVTDPADAAREWVPRLARQADIIIALSHCGQETNEAILARVPGIDLVISGGPRAARDPSELAPNRRVFHAEAPSRGSAGQVVAIAQLRFDDAGRVTQHQWEQVYLVPEVADDPEMSALLRGF